MNKNRLGKPDKIEIFEEDGVKYEKKTWITEEGELTIIKSLSANGEPVDFSDFDKYLNLTLSKDDISSFFDPFQTQYFLHYMNLLNGTEKTPINKTEITKADLLRDLKKAVDAEQYEKAAKLRDEIKALDAKSTSKD